MPFAGTFTFPSVGRCIYCGATDSKLSDEHIIPYSLAGTLVMKNASCEGCSRITGRFEGAVSRSLFGNFRIKHKLPTRRPKERPAHVVVDKENGGRALNIPVSEFPAPAFLYKCTSAGILEGLPPDCDISGSWQIAVIASDAEMRAFQAKFGQGLLYKFRNVPRQFAQTLAKIGHSYAVTQLGLNTFRPLAIDLILGRTTNLSHVVGGSMDIPSPEPGIGHKLVLGFLVNYPHAFVIVDLRLFASIGTPAYHIVVGETCNARSTDQLLDMVSKSAESR